MRLKDAKRTVEVNVYENEIECGSEFFGIEPGDMPGEMEVESVVDEMKKACEWADKEERDWGYSVVDGNPIYCDMFGEPCETEKKFVMFYGRGYDEWKRVFDTEEEAVRECEEHWASLVKEDKKNTTELFTAPMWCVLTEKGWSSETYDKAGNTANGRDTEANFAPVFTIV